MVAKNYQNDEKIPPLGTTTSIRGTPAAYVALWSAIISIFYTIPFSVIIGPGGAFPLSTALYGIVCIILGPAASVAFLVGTLIGSFIAPYISFLGPLTLVGPVITGFSGGLLVLKERDYTLHVFLLGLIVVILYLTLIQILGLMNLPIHYLPLAVVGDAIPASVLYLLTFRKLRRWLSSNELKKLTLATFIITYFLISTILHYTEWIFVNILLLLPLSLNIFIEFVFTWWERLVLAIFGGLVGGPAIYAIKNAKIRKPANVIW